MYRAVHDPRKGGHEVVDAEGSWVAGPWQKMKIAQDLAEALNEAAERRMRLELESQQEGQEGQPG